MIPAKLLIATLCPRTGRWTWPHFIQYRITEGEHKNLVLDNPPKYRNYPAPEQIDPHTGRDTTRVGSVAFKLQIHDLAAYEALHASGALYRREHTGSDPKLEDNRSTS